MEKIKTILPVLLMAFAILISCEKDKRNWTGNFYYENKEGIYYMLVIQSDYNNCLYSGYGKGTDFKVSCVGKSNGKDFQIYYREVLEGGNGFLKPKTQNKPILKLTYKDEKLYIEEMNESNESGKGEQLLFRKEEGKKKLNTN